MYTIIQNIKNFLANYTKELIEAGKTLFHTPMPELTEDLFSEFEQNGNRLSYENIYFQRRKFLSIYGILAIQYQKEEDIKKLETIIFDICKEECWALPAHVNRKENKDWRITIDLFAAETAFSLAEIIEKLSEKISKNIYKTAKKEIFLRVLSPFINSQKPYAWWECSHMNWCAVCNGSIGGAAIYLIKEKEILDPLLSRICSSIINYIDGFSEDGACLEGMGYYSYGMNFFLAFADLIKQYSKGTICFTNSDKFKRIMQFQQKCFLPDKFSLNFSDSSEKETFHVGLTSYMAMLDENVIFPDMDMAAGLESDPCYRYIILSRDLLFSQRFLKMAEKEISKIEEKEKIIKNFSVKNSSFTTILPTAQWAIYYSKNHITLAAKGGDNGEPHNHNDIGSFIYIANGEQVIAELGAGEYTKDYFNENRYHNLCCRSLGHNVPLINNKEQLAGKEYRASYFKAFESNGIGTINLGLETAYGLLSKEKINRTITFYLENGICILIDSFSLQEKSKITENLVSVFPSEVSAHGFLIHTKKADWQIHCKNGTNFTVYNHSYFNHAGQVKTAWLLQWDIFEKSETITIGRL